MQRRAAWDHSLACARAPPRGGGQRLIRSPVGVAVGIVAGEPHGAGVRADRPPHLLGDPQHHRAVGDDAIHENPELSWEEHEAAARITALLEDAGFEVTRGAYGVPTGFEAVYGTGTLTVALCADALPGVGHACGHNVIAAAGVGAALGLLPVADAAGLRVKLLGTPAEEHGGGKVSMLLEGAWEDVDFSMMVHGMTGGDTSASAFRSTAVDRFEVEFLGKTAHAAGAPEKGISASAAATLAQTAIALLRQHLPKESNLNTFISVGGEATNIIAGRTVVQVELRAYDTDVWRDIKKRVLACFESAAIATGCSWSWRPTEHPYAPLAPDADLARLWDRNLEARGRTILEAPLGGGSTDMGNVTSNLITGVLGLYIGVWVSLPLADRLYKALTRNKDAVLPGRRSPEGTLATSAMPTVTKTLSQPKVSLPLWVSLAVISVAGIVVAGIATKTFSLDMVITFALLAALVAAGLGVAKATRGKVPAIIVVMTVGALLTSPISPIAPWLVGVSASVDFLALITVMLTVAGLSLGKDLPMLRSIGWKIIPVGIVAITASFVLSAVVADFALGLWGH